MQGPAETLLALNKEILQAEHHIRVKRLENLGLVAGFGLGPGLFTILIVVVIATWKLVDIGIVFRPSMPVILLATGYLDWRLYDFELKRESGRAIKSLGAIRLELSLLREKRRVQVADLSVGPKYVRSAYKEKIVGDVNKLRKSSRHYRRVHNWLQSAIIVWIACNHNDHRNCIG